MANGSKLEQMDDLMVRFQSNEVDDVVSELRLRIGYQDKFLHELRGYPRSILFDLRDGGFKKAKLVFGDGQYSENKAFGFYRFLDTDDPKQVQPIFMKYEDVKMYQWHLMKMCIYEGEAIEYLRKFNEYCKLVLRKYEQGRG